MDFSSLFSPRVAEERKRLGLSQEAAGQTCGVSREMWGKYERGKAVMGTEVLALFAVAGADVLYILTGQRQGQGIGESAVHRAVLDAVDLLSLGKKLDVEQLANAVVKLCARNSPPPITPSSQVFHGQVGQAIKVEGDLDQSGISFFGGKKGRK